MDDLSDRINELSITAMNTEQRARDIEIEVRAIHMLLLERLDQERAVIGAAVFWYLEAESATASLSSVHTAMSSLMTAVKVLMKK